MLLPGSGNNNAPPTYVVIGCLVSFYKNRHRLLSWYTDLLAVSSTQTVVIQRLGARNTIITANPQNVEYMLKTNFINFPKGKPFTEILKDFLGCGIFNVDGDLWHLQRKLASHQFSSRSLKVHMESTVKEAVKTKLLPLLDSLTDGDVAVDLQEVLRRLGFDIVCKLSLGFHPCCLGSDIVSLNEIVPILNAFDVAGEVSAKRAATVLAATWKMKKVFCVGSEKVLKDSVKRIHEYIGDIIRERKKNVNLGSNSCENNQDLLSKLIEDEASENMIRDMVISFIMAGRDTTSAAMTWLFYVLSRHSHVERELVKEIRCKFKDDDQFENLKEMKYLQACILETMRLYPPVAWDSKHAIDDDVLPDGTPVKAGDRVTYFPYGMGRMESLWGVDRFEFRPDRWFDNESGEPMLILKEVSHYKYPVFHAGPRVCLGKGLANVQMCYVVASILTRFEVKPVRPDEEAMYLPLLTAHMEGGFKVLLRKRG
uniref:cytochrome P450 94B3-like n=1 Tax=Erigeron canadensis TaxID=72917 RepID=UPI001CB91713|nr:cytochrome P450 94B3-like [Erigeron canadensis]